MANREKGESTLTVDGTDYTLRLSINALCEIEDAESTAEKRVTFQELVPRMARGELTAIRRLLWGALREHHPTMSLKAAGDLMQRATVERVIAAFEQMQASTVPDEADLATLGGDKKLPRPPKAARAAAGIGAN